MSKLFRRTAKLAVLKDKERQFKELQDKLRLTLKMNDHLQRKNSELKEANDAKGVEIKNLKHQLREKEKDIIDQKEQTIKEKETKQELIRQKIRLIQETSKSFNFQRELIKSYQNERISVNRRHTA